MTTENRTGIAVKAAPSDVNKVLTPGLMRGMGLHSYAAVVRPSDKDYLGKEGYVTAISLIEKNELADIKLLERALTESGYEVTTFTYVEDLMNPYLFDEAAVEAADAKGWTK